MNYAISALIGLIVGVSSIFFTPAEPAVQPVEQGEHDHGNK